MLTIRSEAKYTVGNTGKCVVGKKLVNMLSNVEYMTLGPGLNFVTPGINLPAGDQSLLTWTLGGIVDLLEATVKNSVILTKPPSGSSRAINLRHGGFGGAVDAWMRQTLSNFQINKSYILRASFIWPNVACTGWFMDQKKHSENTVHLHPP